MLEEENDSPQVFIIKDSYRIEDGRIIACENSELKLLLQPSEHSELPARLSDLHNLKEEDALKFTSEYGLLGYTEMYVESLSNTQKTNFYNSGEKWGDPIDWVMSHSLTIHKIIALLELVEEDDSVSISEFLEEWKSDTKQPVKGAGISYMAGTAPRLFIVNSGIHPDKNEAWTTITNIINSNTGPYISEALHYSDHEVASVIRSYKSKALLPLVYRHLGDWAIGLIKYYKCGYRKCSKRWPENTDGRGPRNRYCPAKVGKESLCSRKERYERSKGKKGGVK